MIGYLQHDYEWVFLFGLGMLKKCSTCALNDNIFHAFSPTTGNVDYKVLPLTKVKQ